MENEKSRRPADTPFKQQRMTAWQPVLTPIKVILIFFVIGIVFIPVGITLLDESNSIYEKTVVYDGDSVDVTGCGIQTANEGKPCTISIDIDEDVDGPVYVYYQLENFYQNHRRYVKSRSSNQLQGTSGLSSNDVSSDCDPLHQNGSLLLNPCGLIANSLFNDVIDLTTTTLTSGGSVSLDESGISWQSDRDVKFNNVDGFAEVVVDVTTYNAWAANPEDTCTANGLETDCERYYDSSLDKYYLYWYPDNANTQYLYESYPKVVSPIEGVENEHFIVWMRTAGLPTFRKLYGKIDSDLKKGDTLDFEMDLNFEVDSFDGSKALVISTLGDFGGKNSFLGISYIVVGSISLLLGVLFALKQAINPRHLGDTRFLGWNN